LYTVDQNDLVIFRNLIDDAIVATSRRPQALEFTDQRLAEPVGVLCDWTEDWLERGMAHLLRKFVEMAETLSRDLDLVHAATSDVILETEPLALFSVPARTPKWLHQIVIFEDVEGFFEGLEVVGTQEDERGATVASDQDTVVLAFHPVGEFGKVGLDFRERNRVTHVDIIGQNLDPYKCGLLLHPWMLSLGQADQALLTMPLVQSSMRTLPGPLPRVGNAVKERDQRQPPDP
jgi:hypothetical protein